MHTIELTDDELRLLYRNSALHAYLDDFGHDEADVLREIKAVLASFLPSRPRQVTEAGPGRPPRRWRPPRDAARPERRNAFDAALIARSPTRSPTSAMLACVVLAGEGQSFCAGADVEWQRASIDLSFDENVEDAMRLYRMLEAVDACPAPVVARVQGYALGGGSGLVACCDIAVAAPDAVFGYTEVRLGIIPAVISPFVIREVGAGARRYFLTGERFDAETALRIGLVHEVAGDLGRGRRAVVEALLQGGPGGRASGEAARPGAPDRRGNSRRSPPGGARARKARTGCAHSSRSGRPALARGVMRCGRCSFLCGAIVLCDTMFFAALTPLLPEYADEFDLSKTGPAHSRPPIPSACSRQHPERLRGCAVRRQADGGHRLVPSSPERPRSSATADSIVVLDTATLLQGNRQRVRVDCRARLADRGRAARAPRAADRHRPRCRDRGALLGPVLGGIAAGPAPARVQRGRSVAIGVAIWACSWRTPPKGSRQPISCALGRPARAAQPRRPVVALPASSSGRSRCSFRCGSPDLGVAAAAIGAVFLVGRGARGDAVPRHGPPGRPARQRYPITIGLVASAIATRRAAVAAARSRARGRHRARGVRLRGSSGRQRCPSLSDTSERIGLDVAWGFALANLAWAPGQATGAAARRLSRHARPPMPSPTLLLAGAAWRHWRR